MLFRRFYPDYRVESVYVIDFEKMYREGVRGVLLDIDNTLVPHGAPADGQTVALFDRLHQIGLNTCLISNNQEDRIVPFAETVNSPFISDAHKPSRRGYEQAMEKMGTNPQNTVFVGDQLFTDILGARRAGIPSWLVQPIHPKEEIQIVFKRYLEKIVLYFYEKEQKRENQRKKG